MKPRGLLRTEALRVSRGAPPPIHSPRQEGAGACHKPPARSRAFFRQLKGIGTGAPGSSAWAAQAQGAPTPPLNQTAPSIVHRHLADGRKLRRPYPTSPGMTGVVPLFPLHRLSWGCALFTQPGRDDPGSHPFSAYSSIAETKVRVRAMPAHFFAPSMYDNDPGACCPPLRSPGLSALHIAPIIFLFAEQDRAMFPPASVPPAPPSALPPSFKETPCGGNPISGGAHVAGSPLQPLRGTGLADSAH